MVRTCKDRGPAHFSRLVASQCSDLLNGRMENLKAHKSTQFLWLQQQYKGPLHSVNCSLVLRVTVQYQPPLDTDHLLRFINDVLELSCVFA